MQTVTQVTQSHLSVLVLDKNSHSPVVRMPIYAELSIVEETITGSGGIYLVDGSTNEEQEESGESSSSVSATVDLVDGNTSEGQDDPQEGLIQLYQDSSSVVGAAAVRSSERKAIYSYPLGYLATDHVGYASFDLTQVSSLIRSRNSNLIASEGNGVRRSYAIFVYPMGKEGERFDVLEQGRFTEEAIFAKLSIEKPALVHDLRILNLPSMQKPSLIDWYFSPGSFTAHPEVLVGENGCERLLPAQIALQEFNIRQVVRVVGASPVSLPADYKFAYIDDYRVTWHSLGHSLGEILYSLPLAPGESVKLAVIDWSWESTTQRTEQTVLTEEILHQTHRDRTISETVKAGLRELQRGSSFMGGVATSAGGSGSTGAIGVAIGNAWSLGGSTATSEGSRDLIAENVQRLNDSFSQASSSQRELSSTVVIQSRQEEKESIQTRTFTNYNHSHTLTILYYEVLRHFKVVVEWVRRRPAILVKYDQPEFDDKTLQIYRPFLEDNLLDPRLKLGFSALDKLRAMQTDDLVNPKAKPIEPLHPRKYAFTTFLFRFEVDEEETSDPVFVSARLADGTSIELKYKNNTNLNESDELFNNDGTYEIALLPTTSIEWGKLVGFDIWVGGDDNLQLNQVGFRGTGTFGSIVELRKFEGPALTFVDRDKRQTVTVNLPGPDLPTLPAPPTPAQRLSVDENAAIELLRNHTNQFKSYYHRLIALNRDPSEIYTKFESANWDATSKLIDHVEPYPLEAFGSYIAYPFVIPNNELPSLNLEGLKKYSEKLATLPTRGVFAEGKLGHCNISEEIDNTRFWKWEEHPIPFEAPGINPATPITPQPQQTDATPTAFPSSLVNIVNPSAAPDPTGLAAALTVLGTPNIFRDMSGQQEVADLLKKLSDNTISIAEAANKAREIQSKYGGELSKGSSNASINSGEAPRLRPDQRSNAAQDMHDMQPILERAQERGLMKPEVAQNIYETAARERFTPEAFFQQVTDRPNNIQLFSPRPTSEKYLREAASVALYDAFDIQNYFMDVTGLNFVQWFRTYVGGRGNWRGLTIADDTDTLSRFTGIWNAVPSLFDSGYATLVEFASLMAIFLNETGGNLAFRLAERVGNTAHPGLSYPFEAFEIIRQDGTRIPKASYNRSPNRTALQNFQDPIFLQQHGQLAPTDNTIRNDRRWGGVVYPRDLITTELSTQTQFIQQADFYKFRGRGPIQLTWRSAYEALVSFIKSYNGTQSVVLEYKQRWTNLSNTDAATASTNQDWDRLFGESDMVIHIASIREHNRISGGYLPLSTDPATLRGNGKGSIVFLATRIAGNNPQYAALVRARVLELLGAIEAMPARPLGMGQGIDL
ncbi:hypothetical protein NIES2107_72870 (plasmid) [Nostoc carneum NIES-2107]|nr:hypothetical protein NIES2107_72870 [Nostoc carneum NIES-2107]